jgi:hypothetical protein
MVPLNRANVFNWSDGRNDLVILNALGRVLHHHIRTTRVTIRHEVGKDKFMAFHKSFESLKEMKWCTHLNWYIRIYVDGLDLSSMSGMTSLQQLTLDCLGGTWNTPWMKDQSKLPLECLPSLTSLTIRGLELTHLAKIQNPLLLCHLDISYIYDWRAENHVTSVPLQWSGIGSFAELLRFKSLHTLRLGSDGKFYRISRLRMRALLASLTHLQRLSIDAFEPLSILEMKESPSTWFGPIPLSLNDIRYFQREADLTSLLAFPSLTKLQLWSPEWHHLVKLAPKLLSLTLCNLGMLPSKGLLSIGKCTRLTSLILGEGNARGFFNLKELKALSLKKLTWHNVDSHGNNVLIHHSFIAFIFLRPPLHCIRAYSYYSSHVRNYRIGNLNGLNLLQSMCSIWCHSLIDLTISRFGGWPSVYGTLDEQIKALTSLCVLEQLTFSNKSGLEVDDLMKLSVYSNLPVKLRNISWVWNPRPPVKVRNVSWVWNPRRRRNDDQSNVRKSFALRGIMCHDIGNNWQVSLEMESTSTHGTHTSLSNRSLICISNDHQVPYG